MTTLDPTEVFRQEASELFETLEAALLDLCQRPDDRELVDSACVRTADAGHPYAGVGERASHAVGDCATVLLIR